MQKIPYGRQKIDQSDIDAINDVLKSDFLTTGPRVLEFEKAFAKYIGSRYAVACSSGTAALHLATMALGFGTGDLTVTSPITFAASANCAIYTGGNVIFSDIDNKSYLLDLNKVEAILASSSKRIKAIIPVGFAGYPFNGQDLKYLSDKYGVKIIQDCCHSIGSQFKVGDDWQMTGNGSWSDMSCYSFHPVKHITTGEGGIVTTNDYDYYHRLLKLRNHGINRNNALSREHGGWYYEVEELGYNYRLTDLQAALGISQLSKLDQNIERRHEIANRYTRELAGMPLDLPEVSDDVKHSYHLYVIQTENRRKLYDYLIDNGVYVQVHYIPLHHMPHFSNKYSIYNDLHNAEEYYKKCLSLPIFHGMTDEQQSYVIEKVKDFFKNENFKKGKLIPVLNKDLPEGSLIDYDNDISFKYAELNGLTENEIKAEIASFKVLAKSKKSGEPLVKSDFRKAVIATIVAARLKSQRLPRKAVLKIGKLSSIEICLKNCLKFQNVDHTILATSDNDQDAELSKYTYSPDVIFHTGDAVDVVQRYMDAIDKYKIDVVVRITGDMQYVSDRILQILIKSHFEKGADYTAPKDAAIGTNIQIVSGRAYRKIVELFDSRRYSGYLTFYFWNNPQVFKVNEINLPRQLVRDYRLTLDYPEDLEMFDHIERYFNDNNLEYDLLELFNFLDNHPEIAKINAHCNVVYKTDRELIDKINKETTLNNIEVS